MPTTGASLAAREARALPDTRIRLVAPEPGEGGSVWVTNNWDGKDLTRRLKGAKLKASMEKERGAGAGFQFDLHLAVLAGEMLYLQRPPRFPGPDFRSRKRCP